MMATTFDIAPMLTRIVLSDSVYISNQRILNNLHHLLSNNVFLQHSVGRFVVGF